MASRAKTKAPACAYVVGDDGLTQWSDTHADAWIGLLETHKRLTRALDAELEAEYGLTISAIEVLGRLAAADGRCMRINELATATGLSVSRISRIADTLESRELIERRDAMFDARAVEAHLTKAGLDLVRAAQASHFASVQTRFFDELSEAELKTLAAGFGRFAPRAAAACTEWRPGRLRSQRGLPPRCASNVATATTSVIFIALATFSTFCPRRNTTMTTSETQVVPAGT